MVSVTVANKHSRPAIHPTAIISSSATLGEGVKVGPYCYVGDNVHIGAHTLLKAHVVVEANTVIGENCMIHPYAVIGNDPQSVNYKGEPTKTCIGHHTIIREYVTINRGTIQGRGKTCVGNHCYLMTSSHIAHDSCVGDYVQFANCATIGGHVVVGDYAILGGLSAVHQFVRIGSYAMISGMAGVKYDVIPYGLVSAKDTKLSGLNLIGLKRRGFSSEDIQCIRRVYTELFERREKPFIERLNDVKKFYKDSKAVDQLLAFIEENAERSLCFPSE